jgi:hypothetical protein
MLQCPAFYRQRPVVRFDDVIVAFDNGARSNPQLRFAQVCEADETCPSPHLSRGRLSVADTRDADCLSAWHTMARARQRRAISGDGGHR